ncbi:MAG TPA: hypothetical protein VE621_08775, partial [Bryobacteraceae bacterium]|nr:hypothetical protein [Bryobacteraceae bacterium]
AVLFHAATGRMPFEGETALAIALKKVSEIAPRARTYRKELPGIWDEVIDRCLEKKPENRPQSANEVLRISRGKPTFRPTRRKVIAGSIAAGVAVAAGAGGIWYGTRKEIPAEALTAFKRGEEFLRRRDEQGLADAVDEFTTAIKIYPEYAEAWASLADAHAAQVHYVFANSAEALKKAEDAAVRALQLNNSLAKAHGALAFVRAADLQRWPEADALFRSAVYNYPNEALLLAWYASYLGRVGRHDEAIGHAQRAVKLEPGSSYFNLQLAVEYWRGLRLDEHLKQARETVRMHPKEYNAHLSLARALEWHRRFEEAEKALDVARMYDARERGRAYWVTLRAAQGRTAEARQHAEVIRKLWDAYTPEGKQDMHIEANVMVSVFASLADVGAVVAVLKTGIERKDSTVLAAATNPYMRELRRESVVREQLARVGLDRVYRA